MPSGLASLARRTGLGLGVPTTDATRTVVATFGVLAALAGIEHGIGEIAQGSVAPAGLVVESWPDAAAFDILSGEPALTVVPDLRVSGILTVAVSIALGLWALGATRRRHGGAVLIGLSALLLLVGGGFGPALVGLVVGVAAARATRSDRRVGRVRRALAPWWPAFLVVGAVGFLGLVPGTVLLAAFAGFESATLVAALGACAFGGLVLAVATALADDGLH